MIKNITVKSKCCGAKVRTIGKLFLYYICTKCKMPCRRIFIKRHVWQRSPVTKIKKSKKIYNRKKLKKIKEEL